MEVKIKRYTVIFRALANGNRLKIITMLSRDKPGKMSVSQIARALKISLKATSNHLVILKNLDVLEDQGSQGHVFYSVNFAMPEDFRKVISVWI
ncbi:MAG: ArsR family transcriptional regulator [Patescibacteria group bacterium]